MGCLVRLTGATEPVDSPRTWGHVGLRNCLARRPSSAVSPSRRHGSAPSAVAARPRAGTQAADGRHETPDGVLPRREVTVPAVWPVHELAGRPGCVRFDRHAVYLGDPSRVTCPADLVGRVAGRPPHDPPTQGVTAPTGWSPPTTPRSRRRQPPATTRRPRTAIAGSVTFDDGTAEVVEPVSATDARTLAARSAHDQHGRAPRRRRSRSHHPQRRAPCRTPPSPARASTPAPRAP